jgi:hypothetical protein
MDFHDLSNFLRNPGRVSSTLQAMCRPISKDPYPAYGVILGFISESRTVDLQRIQFTVKKNDPAK